MEGADGDKHDGVGEGAEDVFGDDHKEVPWLDHAVARKDPHCEVRETRGDETADKGPHPERHGREIGAPFSGVVSKANLEGEVDQDGERHVFLRETLVEEFKVGDGIVGLEANFGDEMDDYEGLDVWSGGSVMD